MGQLVEWLLPTPEIHCSNPVIGKCYLRSTVLNLQLKMRKGGMAQNKGVKMTALFTFLTTWRAN